MLETHNESHNLITESFQIVSFNLGQEEFALNISDIQEIIKVQTFTPIPLTKNYVEGVINIRGTIIPVISLRKKIGFPEKELNQYSRIIVVNKDNRKVGFIVDQMNEVLMISNEQLSSFTSGTDEGTERFIDYICTIENRIIAIFKIESIMDNK